MQFLVLATRADPAPARAPSSDEREAEFEVIRRLYASGVVQQIWFRADGGACIIAESDGAESLAQKFADLPLVKSGHLEMPKVIALKPYSGFGPRSGT
jgi:hypothetical protein